MIIIYKIFINYKFIYFLDDLQSQFNDYIQKHNKKYSSDVEYATRFANFQVN